MVGTSVGDTDGWVVGVFVGNSVGLDVSDALRGTVCIFVGPGVGDSVGMLEGTFVGSLVGNVLGVLIVKMERQKEYQFVILLAK